MANVLLIGGTSHTGKTNLAQKLMDKYGYPYLSIDHIKMGFIRSGYTDISVEEDDKLTDYLWPVIKEMIKTVIENNQKIIIEGCYIPYDWKDSFTEEYLKEIQCFYLIMSEKYIDNHFEDIRKYGSVIEDRGDDEDCTIDSIKKGNMECLAMCKKYGCDYQLIDEKYEIDDLSDIKI